MAMVCVNVLLYLKRSRFVIIFLKFCYQIFDKSYMMEMHFPVPQKKKKRGPTHERFSSLFPIPILAADRQKPSFCPYFIGKLEGNHVVVKHSGDAYYLYKMVSF